MGGLIQQLFARGGANGSGQPTQNTLGAANPWYGASAPTSNANYTPSQVSQGQLTGDQIAQMIYYGNYQNAFPGSPLPEGVQMPGSTPPAPPPPSQGLPTPQPVVPVQSGGGGTKVGGGSQNFMYGGARNQLPRHLTEMHQF
jgi:hypothetical protein